MLVSYDAASAETLIMVYIVLIGEELHKVTHWG